MKRQLFFGLLLGICPLLTSSFCKAQNWLGYSEPERERFEKMADYLTKGSGKWTGENKRHNPSNPRSAKAFGLWFERPLKNVLTIKIVAYQKDTTIVSSYGTFLWHPIKKQILHTTSDSGYGYSEGVSEFPNDSTFTSTMIIYRPNGKISDHKDENYIISENIHCNKSFGKDPQGNWVEGGKWTWIRDREN